MGWPMGTATGTPSTDGLAVVVFPFLGERAGDSWVWYEIAGELK